ncbi:MAG: 3-oxoacyl-ACP synthase [Nostoc sp. TH1S01]|nr:3-oxoacyl-ACP synthase [Nostoc sp. TH1S01]
MAYIVATSTGFPEHYYPQEVLATALKKYFLIMDLEFDLEAIDRFFTNVKINGRYFTFPLDSFYDPPAFTQVNNQAITKCLNVIETTVTKLLDKAAIDPQDISQLTATTLISATPGLDARLINRIPFSPDIKRMALTGVGCMGGAFGLARIADYLKGHPTESSVLFAMEPSSALWQGSLQRDLSYMIQRLPEDPAIYSDIIMTIVTAALFGDGSAAVLMVGEDHPLAQPGQPRILDSRSIILPNTLHLMGMDLVETGTRNILRPEVADYVKVALHKTIDPLLADHNLSTDNIVRWIVHPGGPKILSAIQEEFGLDEQLLQGSWDALAEIGNISSSTVLYILDKTLAAERPPAGSYGLLLAMGPGFSQEVILLQW